jgi:phosphopantothenoylcysteine synthetase/decarboxylase
MNCLVTAGPTHENLDEVRRLTNFSTGRLGSELAAFLVTRGHRVTLLLGEQATCRGNHGAADLEMFSTTADLAERLRAHGTGGSVGAVFHAAAVSDFAFGKIWRKSADGSLAAVDAGKIPTREGTLLAELVPTPKLISRLREWYPRALLVGWKYEVDGGRDSVLELARRQIAECRTDACVANGPAYGEGFGLVTASGGCDHLRNSEALFEALTGFMKI